MAKEKEKKEKKPNFFKKAGSAIAGFFKGIVSEIKKVTWPTNEHCVVLSAYDYTNNTVILNDPTFGVVSMNMEKVKKRYDQLGKNAVIIFKE